MAKQPQPITVYTLTAEEARRRAAKDKDGRALLGPVGTLAFHSLIAQHGAGEFRTLYCPASLRDKWRPPAGGVVKIQKK